MLPTSALRVQCAHEDPPWVRQGRGLVAKIAAARLPNSPHLHHGTKLTEFAWSYGGDHSNLLRLLLAYDTAISARPWEGHV
jgi:hypothetical protein